MRNLVQLFLLAYFFSTNVGAMPTQYTYSGTSLVPAGTTGAIQNQFTSNDSLSFRFWTADVLAPNGTYNASSLTGWSVADGIFAYDHNQGLLYSFSVSTDLNANIAHWDVVGGTVGYPGPADSLLFSMQSDFSMSVIGFSGHFWDLVGHSLEQGQYFGVAPQIGTWSYSSINLVPEPSTLLLSLSAFVGLWLSRLILMGNSRRRLANFDTVCRGGIP